MARKLSTWNHNHPILIRNRYVEQMRKTYQTLKHTDLIRCTLQQLAGMTKEAQERYADAGLLPRHLMVAWLVEVDKIIFEVEWKKRNGFDIEDCRDDKKFAEIMKEHKAKQEDQAQTLLEVELGPPVDMTKIWTPEGEEMSKEDYDALLSQKLEGRHEEIRLFNMRRLFLLNRMGYAGVLGEKNAMLVDRRYPAHRHAISVPKNASLGVGEPVKLRTLAEEAEWLKRKELSNANTERVEEAGTAATKQ